jgi:uncharacterized protein
VVMHTTWFAVLLALLLAAGSPALAQSASELLQKGIYTQETLGDLDGAIKIYKQLLAQAKGARVYAAQAQYRLARCYLAKGQSAEAVEAFKELIRDYPEQKELVAKARENVPGELKLLAEPWLNGETLQFTAKLPAGMKIGTVIWSADLVQLQGREAWRLQSRHYGMFSNAVLRVFADRDAFRPSSSIIKHSQVGEIQIDYEPGQVKIKSAGKDSVRKVELEGVVYDNEQAMYLIRRLPLSVGYKASLQVFSPLGSGTTKVGIEVTGKEMVQVPAGRFECFKTEFALPIGKTLQTFWYSTDSRRYLVKFEAGEAIAELVAIRQSSPHTSTDYRDEKFNFSLSLPSGWFLDKDEAEDKPRIAVHLLDPEAAALNVFWIDAIGDGQVPPESEVRAACEKKVTERLKELQGYKARPESWKPRTLSGAPAVSCVADYVEGKRPMVEYLTLVQTGFLQATLIMRAPREQLDGLRETFERIMESLRLK